MWNNTTAVSYTHLDVYKRQALERERKIQKAALAIKKKYGKNAILKAMNLEAVSYTHLDVYKRQLQPFPLLLAEQT